MCRHYVYSSCIISMCWHYVDFPCIISMCWYHVDSPCIILHEPVKGSSSHCYCREEASLEEPSACLEPCGWQVTRSAHCYALPVPVKGQWLPCLTKRMWSMCDGLNYEWAQCKLCWPVVKADLPWGFVHWCVLVLNEDWTSLSSGIASYLDACHQVGSFGSVLGIVWLHWWQIFFVGSGIYLFLWIYVFVFLCV